MEGTWFVVADSVRARVFALDKRGQRLTQVQELNHPQSRWHEGETDMPVGTLEKQSPGRYDLSESVSPKEHGAWKLCKAVADMIETARVQGRLKRLILVAAPQLMGELRKTLSDQAKLLVAKELDKNLASMEESDILAHLPADFLE